MNAAIHPSSETLEKMGVCVFLLDLFCSSKTFFNHPLPQGFQANPVHNGAQIKSIANPPHPQPTPHAPHPPV